MTKEERERLQRENEDLKSAIADYQEAVGDYQDEIERKENIINELKEWLEEEKENYNLELTKKNEGALSYSLPIKNVYRQVLDKIKELESKGE